MKRIENPPPKPLYKKLGIKDSSSILILNPPKNYLDFFSEFPSGVIIKEKSISEQFEFIHFFVRTREELEYNFHVAKSCLSKNGILWISWPKKSSITESELDKSVILKYGLENGLVDTKVASLDENWSAHKFVYRLKNR